MGVACVARDQQVSTDTPHRGAGSHPAEVRDSPEPSLRSVLASDWSAGPSLASDWWLVIEQSGSRDESSLGPRSWERPRWGQSSGYIRHPLTQDICHGLFSKRLSKKRQDLLNEQTKFQRYQIQWRQIRQSKWKDCWQSSYNMFWRHTPIANFTN